MSKFKVGDKVKVRSDLILGKWYGGDNTTSEMVELKGNIVTIKKVLCPAKYAIKECGYCWTDEMFEDPSKPIKAYELMKLADENPTGYEGKRYKVSDTLINRRGERSSTAIIVDGTLRVDDENRLFAHINSLTELQEIKPEPKPVPFVEAMEAIDEGKEVNVIHNGNEYIVKASKSSIGKGYWLKLKIQPSDSEVNLSTKIVLNGQWYIKP